MQDKALKLLRQLFNVLEDEISSNPRFAENLVKGFGERRTPLVKVAPPFNAYDLFSECGLGALEKALENLDEPELMAVSKDSGIRVSRRKNNLQEMRAMIIDRVESLAKKGDAFNPPQS